MLLLEVLFGEVLQVTAREIDVSHNLNLVTAHLIDDNGITQVARPTIDLYAIMKEFLKL